MQKAQVNVLDEVLHSYSYQRNPKLDQIRYIIETHDNEYVDSKVARLLSKVYALMCRRRTYNHRLSFCAFSH
jgi:hypothetical protein